MPGRKSPFSNVYSRQPMLAFGLSPMELQTARSASSPSGIPPPPPPPPLLSARRVSAKLRSLPPKRSKATKKASGPKKCGRGKERHPVSGRCVKKCGRGKMRHPSTHRCVKRVCTRSCSPADSKPRKESPVSAELKKTFNGLLSTYGESIALKGGVTEKRLPSWVRFPSKIRGMPKKLSKVDAMKRVGSLLSVCKRNGVSLLDKKGKFFKTFGTLPSECKFRVRPQVMDRVEKRMGLAPSRTLPSKRSSTRSSSVAPGPAEERVRWGLTPEAVRARYGPESVVEAMGRRGKEKMEFGASAFRRLAAFGAPTKKRSTRKTAAKKSVPRPSAAVRRMCKKYGVKITLKRGSKRVYKSEKVLKAQCKKKMKMAKKSKKTAPKRKTVRRRADSGRKSYFGLW